MDTIGGGGNFMRNQTGHKALENNHKKKLNTEKKTSSWKTLTQ